MARPEGLPSTLAAALAPQAAAALGTEVTLVPLVAGGSRAAFRVETEADDHAAFLRVDDGNSGMSGTEFDLAREARVMQRARDHGIPVPRVLAVFAEPSATLLEYVQGSSSIDRAAADRIGPELMHWVAEIHRLDADAIVADGVTHPTTTAAVRADLEWWIARAVAQGLDRNALGRLAMKVLRATVPEVDDPPQLVHGDVGAGNFLVADDRIAAMLDWELAHVGDAHEDLAWLWMRGAHSELGDPHQRFAEYVEAGGRPIDDVRLRWQLAFVIFKTQVALRGRLQQPGGGRLVLTQHVFLLLYEALLGSALAGLCGRDVELLAEAPEVEVTPAVRLVDAIAELVPLGGDDPTAKQLRIAIENTRGLALLGPWERRRLAADLHRLGVDESTLLAAIDEADGDGCADLAVVLAHHASRAAQASTGAVRRLRRAAAIGLCVCPPGST